MKRFKSKLQIKAFVGILLIVGIVLGSVNLSAQTGENIEDIYQEARTNYYQKNYAKAINLFTTIQGINPTYKAIQIRHYLRVAKAKLGKTGVKTKFKTREEPTREIQINKEGELEVFTEEVQKVILDTTLFLDSVRKSKKLSDFEILEPTSTLRMAREAYIKDKFTEAIRLANKARFQAQRLIEEKEKDLKPVLGEIGQTKVTLNLTNADLEQTLKLIYDLTGANIVLSKGVSGRVTINIKELPLQQVLNLICESNHLRYLEEDKVIKIMTEEEYGKRENVQKAFQRRVFPILYGEASLIAKALKETFKLESIVYEPRTNSVIVDVLDPNLARQIEEVISALDSPISQVLLEAKIIEIAASDESLFGIDWMVSARLIEKLGTPFTLTGPRFGNDITFTPGNTSSLPSGFSFGVTNNDANALITALATRGKVKLIQSPKIMCLNGTNALIRVVQNYPYIIPEYEETYNPQTGSRTGTKQTVTVYEEEVGTEFIVTPIIQRNRTVFLNLSIIDSRLVEIKKLTAIAADLKYETEQPIISTRETSQNVSMFDGQTLVIGGMIQERKEVKESGIPFLRRIPLLGYLFKKPTYTKSKSELLMFLTPYIVTTYEEAETLSKPDREKADEEIKGGLLEKF